MSLSLTGNVCTCEHLLHSEDVRIMCLRRALLSFYKSRRQYDLFPKHIFEHVRKVGLIKFDMLQKYINNPTVHAAESVILLRFLQNYAITHPLFAVETVSVEYFKRTSELFKEI